MSVLNPTITNFLMFARPADSTKKAVRHYHAIINFEFVVTLTVCQAVLAFVKGLTVKMQGSCNDILGVFHDIKDVLKTLSSVRQKIEEKHAKWFQEACRNSEKLDITVQKPEPVRCSVTVQTPLPKQ